MKVFTYSEARQQFASVLDSAQKEGGVQVTRRDGQVFEIKPLKLAKSPLDVKGVETGITKAEILQHIRQSRRV
jgi:antitoxin (DNA-binding transcriptional repressor) of toxin-antitoxin stability system